jgi:nickel/cobalt transporter (NiCoT) family protein
MSAFSLSAVAGVLRDSRASVRRKIGLIYLLLAILNAGAWALALVLFRGHPLLIGTALLAYTFGLRHAVDADHISAIDNVTRKLIHEGQRPVSVGLFFSLGHSTIVVALSLGIALAASQIRTHLPALESTGGVIGGTISAVFLIAIALANIAVLIDVIRASRRSEAEQESLALPGGPLGKVLRPVMRLVDSSWKMYPTGVLFGLGFDTATEVGLLGIAAIAAGNGLPIAAILVFPLLFTAAMSLIDTTDGILMLGAYGWALVDPARKLFYNATVTIISIVTGLAIGGIEAISLAAQQLHLGGGAWRALDLLGTHSGTAGLIIIATLCAAWLMGSFVRGKPKRS